MRDELRSAHTCSTAIHFLRSFFFFSSRRRHTRCSRDWRFRRVLFRSAPFFIFPEFESRSQSRTLCKLLERIPYRLCAIFHNLFMSFPRPVFLLPEPYPQPPPKIKIIFSLSHWS